MSYNYCGVLSNHKLSKKLIPAFLSTFKFSKIINSDEIIPEEMIPVFFGSELYFSHIKRLIADQNKFIYIDHAYLNRKQYNKLNPSFRVICNNLHPDYLINDGPDRFRKNNLNPKKISSNGDNIILCLPSLVQQDTLDFHVNDLIYKIRSFTDRTIEIRARKHGKKLYHEFNNASNICFSKDELFEDSLKNSWCCISLNSVVGVRSLYYGIPVFCVLTDPASSSAHIDFSKIEEPKCHDTINLFKHIAWCEYSFSEIENGYALNSINKFL